MVDLDNVSKCQEIDEQHMLDITATYPEQWQEVNYIMSRYPSIRKANKFTSILFVGTGGGSAAAAHLLHTYLTDLLAIPFNIYQGYGLPAYVNEDTLVIAMSYSGRTEETLSAVAEAIRRGSEIITLSTGGQLKSQAQKHNLTFIPMPDGIQPRSAIALTFGLLLRLLEKLHLIPTQETDWEEALVLMRTCIDSYCLDVPIQQNQAKQVATGLYGKIPVIYGGINTTAGLAWRLKNQLSENGKVLAMANSIPNIHHTEMVGWMMPAKLTKSMAVIFIRDLNSEDDKLQQRFLVTKEIIQERAGFVTELHGSGQSKLAYYMTMLMLMDYISIYTALLYRQDPTPVDIITQLKRKMGQEK